MRRQRVVHVGDADDLRQQRHLVPAQALRIPAAVEPLVVAPDDRPHGAQRLERRAQRIADIGMLLHQLEFGGRERARLQQHRIGNADLADVVQIAAAMQRLQIFVAERRAPCRAPPHGCASRSQ